MRVYIRIFFFALVFSVAAQAALAIEIVQASQDRYHVKQGDVIVVRLDRQGYIGEQVRFDNKYYPVFGNVAFIPTTATTRVSAHEIGFNNEVLPVDVVSGNFKKLNINLPPSKRKETSSPAFPASTKSVSQALNHYAFDFAYIDDFIIPVDGEISESYGTKRTLNKKTDWGYHGGIDIAAGAGTPVKASNGGIVELSGKLPVYGNVIVINHGQGFATVYMHMKQRYLHEGDPVDKGEIIGEVGNTGLSTGAHLHWGMYLHGEKINPTGWIRKQDEIRQALDQSNIGGI